MPYSHSSRSWVTRDVPKGFHIARTHGSCAQLSKRPSCAKIPERTRNRALTRMYTNSIDIDYK